MNLISKMNHSQMTGNIYVVLLTSVTFGYWLLLNEHIKIRSTKIWALSTLYGINFDISMYGVFVDIYFNEIQWES